MLKTKKYFEKPIIGNNEKQHTPMGIGKAFPSLIGQSEDIILQALEAKVQTVGLVKTLIDIHVITTGKCGPDLDLEGYHIEPDGEVAVTLQALTCVASLALKALYAQPLSPEDLTHIQRPSVANTLSCLQAIWPHCLMYNTLPAPLPPAIDREEKLVQILLPLSSSQERFTMSVEILLARLNSWYRTLPAKDEKYSISKEIESVIIARYGCNSHELMAACFALYTAARDNRLIVPSVFQNFQTPSSHPAQKLLSHYAKKRTDYEHATIEEERGTAVPLSYSTPILVKYPIVEIDKDVWSVPIPRLIPNMLVETIHWHLFDTFREKNKESSHPTSNAYTAWFGAVFEKYTTTLLKALFTRKLTAELYYPKSDHLSPDAMEVHCDRGLLVEVKSGHTPFNYKQFSEPAHRAQFKEESCKRIGQLIKFINNHAADGVKAPVNFSSVKNYILCVVTPEKWLANPFVAAGLA